MDRQHSQSPVIVILRRKGLFIFLLAILAACGREDEPLQQTAPELTAIVQAPSQTAAQPTSPPTAAADAAATAAPAFSVPRIEQRPCQTYNPAVGEVEGESYRCGVMFVRQDRSREGSQEIEIKYAVLKSFADEPERDAILFLSGGPGNSALYADGFVELARRFWPMRQTRDIVLFDQRGVGASMPALNCATVPPIEDKGRRTELLERYVKLTGVERNEENQFTVDCVLGLWSQGVDLSQYTSSASAADTVDLMRALKQAMGYESYNLYGISYGTRLAETIARDNPGLALIRTIIMDSVFPRPEGEYEAGYYIGKHEMFESLFAACEEDAACHAAYPDLQQRFNNLVDQLNSRPLQLPDESTLSGEQLYQFMFPFEDRGPTWVPRIPYLPRMIYELEQGIFETYVGLRDGSLPPQSPLPDVPESVFATMDLLSNCTAVTDEPGKNDLYRQLFNIVPGKRAGIIKQLCTAEQAGSVLAKMQAMSPENVNEVVKRLYIADFRSTSPFARTQFNCNEAFPFSESAQTLADKMREAEMPQFLIDEGVAAVDQATKTCRVWPSGTAARLEIEPISSGYRALLLNGQWDYVTYPKWAEAVNRRWSASAYAFIPNAMHSLLSNYGDCPTDITLQFLNDPAQPVDISCTEAMTTEWIMP